MSARPKVTRTAIEKALREWRGNITNAALALGVARNSLYERAKKLQLDLRGFRIMTPTNPVTPNASRNKVSGMPGNQVSGIPVSGIAARARSVQKKSSAIFPWPLDGPRLGAVQTMPASEDEAEAAVAVPIKTAPKRQERLRLMPDLQERLQRAVWQLQAHFQAPTNESLILEQVVEELLDVFVRSKLDAAFALALRELLAKPASPAAAPVTPRRKKNSDEGSRG
jgi:hypothetical protein